MQAFALGRAGEAVDLGGGYAISSNRAALSVGSSEGRGAGARALLGTDLDALLEAAGLQQDRVLTIAPEPASAERARDIAAPATITLTVPRRADTGAVLLVEDELGALSWRFPDGHSVVDPDASTARALAPALTFTVPVGPAPSAPGTVGERGLLDIGSKVVKVFLYRITDEVLGPIVRGFAGRWESANRPYVARDFTPANYKEDRRDFPPLADADWHRLAAGRALLWVHGTFTTCGGFGAIAPEVMHQLCDRYGGRSFAFNHCTLTADPAENARALLQRIPAGVELDVDIVCHSRGGLVARELARLGPAGAGAGGGTLRVGRIVLVAVPNAGTVLADDDHMTDVIDRFTTVAKLFPSATVQKIVESVVLVIKVLAHGFLHDLRGLSAMNPHGSFLPEVNAPGDAPPEYYAIASDFDPSPGTALFSLARVENGAADRVFAGVPNDLVVPRDGVFARNGATGFPIPDDHCFRFEPPDGVTHTEYFSRSRTQGLLVDWLGAVEGGGEQGRPVVAARPAARTFSPDELSALRPHVVNLSEGRLRRSGDYYTPPEDVDAIFDQHIPAWQAQHSGAPLRIVFYAHGGLVSESDGLAIAQKHVAWWKRNGVYPVYFVWESAFFDAMRSILASVTGRVPGIAARDIWDYTTDPLVERGCRALGGVKIWGAMKANAQAASAADGGATYLAGKLAAFCARAREQGVDVQLHAVGHSAGAIFQSHFVPRALEAGAPDFATVQLLAPAIRVDEFRTRLLPHVGNGAGRLTMYTMQRHFEEADNCIGVYHKSLLYLVHHALEPEHDAPILGLEMATRADAEVRKLFGLDGGPHAAADVVWSVSAASTGQSASRSTSHGAFDDDAATMSSVAARVLGTAAAPVPYTGERKRALDGWPINLDWLKSFDVTGLLPALGAIAPDAGAFTSSPHVGGAASQVKPPAVVAKPSGGGPGAGRRIALCVGIDHYPEPNALAGCVNDTNAWGGELASLGFQVKYLRNAEATYAAITDRLRALVEDAHPGDVLVFQYAGHGTQVPSADDDESADGGGGQDQALVPVDFGSGAFLVDDDIRAILVGLPQGVNMTVFTDCCHSATNTRMLGWNPPAPPAGSRARYIVPTQEQLRAHRRFRESMRSRGVAREAFDRTMMRWVAFAACQKQEVAYESEGHGAYTLHATSVLRSGLAGVTNLAFHQRVVAAFGTGRSQTPYLDCAPTAEQQALLAGITSVAPTGAERAVKVPAGAYPSALRGGTQVTP